MLSLTIPSLQLHALHAHKVPLVPLDCGGGLANASNAQLVGNFIQPILKFNQNMINFLCNSCYYCCQGPSYLGRNFKNFSKSVHQLKTLYYILHSDTYSNELLV